MVESSNQNVRRRSSIGLWLIVIVVACVALGATVFAMRDRSAEAYRRGRAALLNGDRESVIREADLLIAMPGHQCQGWLLKGLLLSRLDKRDEAVFYLEKSAGDEALAVEANTLAAKCLYETGLYRQAIEAANRALQRDASCVDARRWLAASYYDLGALAHATEELKRISQLAPDDPKPSHLLGVIAMDGERYPEAIQRFQESLSRDPSQPGKEAILVELAECQLKTNQSQQALDILAQCSPTAPVLTLMANALETQSKIDEAQAKLEAAIRLDAKYVPAKLALGKLLLDRGQIREALPVLAEAVKLEPMNREAHFQLSQACRRADEPQRADEELSRMQEIGAWEREFSSLHAEAAKDPHNGELRFRLGELALRLGKPKLARVWYRAAIAINPSDSRSQSALRQLEPES